MEVANLGWPGACPSEYAEIAGKAIPRLRPAGVLVAVLQGEDFAQLWFETLPLEERLRRHSAGELVRMAFRRGLRGAGRLLSRAYPNLMRAGESAPPAPPVERAGAETVVTADWAGIAGSLEAGWGESRREALGRIDPEVLRAFRAGRLNPTLVSRAVREPDYYRLTQRIDTARGREVIATLSRRLKAIRSSIEARGGRVLVVAVPLGAYVDPKALESLARLGYRTDPAMLVSAGPDQAIARAASAAGVEFLSVTDRFRREAPGAHLYFPLDAHFTPEGHRLYAEVPAAALAGWPGSSEARPAAPASP